MDFSASNGYEKKTTNRVYKVVLTGGPCGGKTTGQSRLCTFFENLGWKVYRVPETASILLSGGIKFGELSQDQAIGFQENLLKAMIEIETTFFRLSELCNKNCLVICDRGTMDASAFISPTQWDDILRKNGLNSIDLRDSRYHQIIHMVSAANGAEAFYSTEDHSCRSENLDLAQQLDSKAAQAWVGHPYFDVIDNSSDFDTKIRRMIFMVCQKIGIDTGDRLEIDARKLKFLVQGPLPEDSIFPQFADFNVEHIYLKTNSRKMQARLRKRGKNSNFSYTHTIRKPEKLGQIVEVKTAITQRDWAIMQAQGDEHHFPIYKKRRCFLYDNQYFQLDIYQDPCHPRCKGMSLLETYSTRSLEEMSRRLPPFLNIVGNVTGQANYSMFNLSLKDEWSNSKKFCHNIAVELCFENDDEDSGLSLSTSPSHSLPSPSSTIHRCPQISVAHTDLVRVYNMNLENLENNMVSSKSIVYNPLAISTDRKNSAEERNRNGEMSPIGLLTCYSVNGFEMNNAPSPNASPKPLKHDV